MMLYSSRTTALNAMALKMLLAHAVADVEDVTIAVHKFLVLRGAI